jgi:GTPase
MAHTPSPSDPDPAPARETVLLAAVRRPADPDWATHDALDELEGLVASADAAVAERCVFVRRAPDPGLYIGRGQAADLGRRAAAHHAAAVVFDEDLSPAQGRNLERIVGVRVVDRTPVILDIFARRARTSEGRLQVELAQLHYLLPRLRRMWTHLERQKGGIGLKGPGEQQLELDRRRIEVRIDRIRRDLDAVRTRRHTLRQGRARHGWALICLVGYTNAGKSTLLNALSAAGVQADDRLFATLDPTTRRIALPNREPALLTDTVGFIRKLPHRLIEAFRATLEEVVEADLLVHVADASHPGVEGQMDAVARVLDELGAQETPCVTVLNKCDAPGAAERARALAGRLKDAVRISARTGEGLDRLRDALADHLRDRAVTMHLSIPAAEGKILALIHEQGHLHSEAYEGDRVNVCARIPRRWAGPLSRYATGGAHGPADADPAGSDGNGLPD